MARSSRHSAVPAEAPTIAAARARRSAALAIGLAVAVALAMQAAAAVLDRPLALLALEPQTALDGDWYTGAMSNVGNVAWIAGAAVCLLAWLVERSLARPARPLLLAGLLLTVIGADDLFLLHEGLYRKVIGERWVFAFYLILFAAYAVTYRSFLRRYGGLAVLSLGIGFLIVSALLDEYTRNRYLLEDGAKLMGIGTIVSLFVVIAYTRLRSIHVGEE